QVPAAVRGRRADPDRRDHRGDPADAAPPRRRPHPEPGEAGARAGARSRPHRQDGGGEARREAGVEHAMITLAHFLTLGAVLFCIAVAGIFLNRKNVITLLMALELMLLAGSTNCLAFSRWLGDPGGQVFVFFILTVAAAESAIGLAILVVLFRNRATINV